MKKGLFALAALLLAGCSSANLDDVKAHAAETWEAAGFQIIGYEGYNVGGWLGGSSYGGAYAWYTLRRIPDNGITYEGAIQRWGTEYHIYKLTAIDAIKP